MLPIKNPAYNIPVLYAIPFLFEFINVRVSYISSDSYAYHVWNKSFMNIIVECCAFSIQVSLSTDIVIR